MELLEARVDGLAKLRVALGERVGESEEEPEGARLTERVTEMVSVLL